MRVGIVILQEHRWAEAADKWRRAEQYGFAHAWVYDHVGWRDLVDGPWFDAVPTLTAAATVTSRIRLGTCVASPTFRHPVSFARQITALDDISSGRFILGVGAGTGVPSFDAQVLGSEPLTPGQRIDRLGEFVRLLDPILRDIPTTWSGDYYRAVDARGTPGCVQQPRVPFVIAAGGPRGMRIAAQYGQGWMTTGTHTDDPDAWWKAVAEQAARFEEMLAGRTMDRYLSLDAGLIYSLSSVDAFTDAVGRATELGFTDVITHWPRPAQYYVGSESTLDAVADLLPGMQTC